MCIKKGLRYEGFIQDKLKYRTYEQIKKSDPKGDIRFLVFTQKRIINVEKQDKYFLVSTYNETFRLINMDSHFYLDMELKNQQTEKLCERIQPHSAP